MQILEKYITFTSKILSMNRFKFLVLQPNFTGIKMSKKPTKIPWWMKASRTSGLNRSPLNKGRQPVEVTVTVPGVSAKVPGITNKSEWFPVFLLTMSVSGLAGGRCSAEKFSSCCHKVIWRKKYLKGSNKKFNLTEVQVWFGLGICLVVDRRCCSYSGGYQCEEC